MADLLDLLAELADFELLADDACALELAALALELLADAAAVELAPLERGPPRPSAEAAAKAMAITAATHMMPMAMVRGERFEPVFAWAGLKLDRAGWPSTGVPQS